MTAAITMNVRITFMSPVQELAVVHSEVEVREVRLAADGRDERSHDIATKALTTAANAVPMTTAIARSMSSPEQKLLELFHRLPHSRSGQPLSPSARLDRKPETACLAGRAYISPTDRPDGQLGAMLKVQQPRADDSSGVRASARPSAARAGPSCPGLHGRRPLASHYEVEAMFAAFADLVTLHDSTERSGSRPTLPERFSA